MLNQLKLKEHLKYDQETGKFIWVKPTTHMVSEGEIKYNFKGEEL